MTWSRASRLVARSGKPASTAPEGLAEDAYAGVVGEGQGAHRGAGRGLPITTRSSRQTLQDHDQAEHEGIWDLARSRPRARGSCGNAASCCWKHRTNNRTDESSGNLDAAGARAGGAFTTYSCPHDVPVTGRLPA